MAKIIKSLFPIESPIETYISKIETPSEKAGDTKMADTYSKAEIDLKLSVEEQKTQRAFDSVLHKIDTVGSEIKANVRNWMILMFFAIITFAEIERIIDFRFEDNSFSAFSDSFNCINQVSP